MIEIVLDFEEAVRLCEGEAVWYSFRGILQDNEQLPLREGFRKQVSAHVSEAY